MDNTKFPLQSVSKLERKAKLIYIGAVLFTLGITITTGILWYFATQAGLER